jgi:hypothetical protein
MKIFTFLVPLLLIISIPFNKLCGQLKLNLNIDTQCVCLDSTKPTLQGSLGLYHQVATYPYSSKLKDTLVNTLSFIKQQALAVKEGHYKLIFTPFDTTQKPNVHYFYPYQRTADIQLTCFFFNKIPNSLLAQMEEIDTLTFYTSYYGRTHEEMLIPASQISIIKKQNAYYMAYNKCAYYQQEPVIVRKKLDLQLVLLTEKQVELLRQFEKDIATAVIKDNLLEYAEASNRISLRGKQILFYSKWSISESLYKRLSLD